MIFTDPCDLFGAIWCSAARLRTVRIAGIATKSRETFVDRLEQDCSVGIMQLIVLLAPHTER